VQPFYSHSSKRGLTIGVNSEATYDSKRDQLTVPLNFTVAQLTVIGEQRASIGGGLRYYVTRAQGGPGWGLRLIFTLLFPNSQVDDERSPLGTTDPGGRCSPVSRSARRWPRMERIP
jgi:hypothetical protein